MVNVTKLFTPTWHLSSQMRRVLLCLPLLLLPGQVFGQSIYSYINDRGVKVFTNHPSRRSPVPVEEEQAPSVPEDRVSPFLPLIEKTAAKYDIDQDLIEAIIAVESDFDPRAVSYKNCKGLMQLHPDTARRFGVQDVFDPAENIEGGVRYLRFLIDHFDGDLERILAAYNAGENAVARHDGVPPFSETRNYIKKIKRLYDFASWDANGPSPAALAARAQQRRVQRITLADGRVVYTNTPSVVALYE